MTDRNAKRGWGRLLSVLHAHGLLDPTRSPSQLISAQVMQVFIDALLVEDNCHNTIITRVWDVRRALKIMEPSYDSFWMTKPGGIPLRSLLPVEIAHVPLIGIALLWAWVRESLEAALRIDDPIQRALALRNGLLLGVLVARAPRGRSLALMQVGRNLRIAEDGYWVQFTGDELKVVGRRLDYRLPPELPPYMRRYLDADRHVLLGGQVHDALWVGQSGAPLGQAGISAMIQRATRARFGAVFGTHRFRHELATALARDYPDNPGLCAAILGVSLRVAMRYYVQPLQDQAATRVAAHLARERERTRGMAQREFGVR